MTGAVLAGGMSRRMGFNKALIRVGGGGKETLIQRCVKTLGEVFDDVIVVTNDVIVYEDLRTTVVADIYKGAGSLGGIYTALFHIREERGAFVCACDMPYLDAGCIRKVMGFTGDFDAVVPFISGRLHPMHAFYSRNCMKPIEEMIKGGDLRISGLLERIRIKRLVTEDFKSLPIAASVENINTREDLSRLTGAGTVP